MLNVACVKVGARYTAEYVNVLFDSVRRNLPAGFPGRFVCFTDDATGLDPAIVVKSVPEDLASRGWWAKLYLFSEDAFPKGERVLYFDLDTVITGPLDAVAAYDGPFAILRDVYRANGWQSSVMAWEAGSVAHIWGLWNMANRPEKAGGDQEWIEIAEYSANFLQDLFPNKFKSYKEDCRAGIPQGCSVVFFHGRPRPHEVKTGWVPEVWKVGGGSGVELFVMEMIPDEALKAQALDALRRPNWLKSAPKHNGTAIIVGGGPSLADTLHYVKGMQLNGATVFATNNAYNFLVRNGIHPNAHVMLDPRRENIDFVPQDAAPKFYASQCHPDVLDAAGDSLVCWHSLHYVYRDEIARRDPDAPHLGGGSTVGLRAMSLAYALGYRDFRLFGFDSSYRESHHAYPQPLNDHHRTLEVKAAGETFRCAPWMVSQAEDFKGITKALVENDCTVSVYGDGLIPAIAREMGKMAADERCEAILKHIEHIDEPMGAEVGVFMGALSKRLLRGRDDLRLILVDAWRPYGTYSRDGDFHADMSVKEHEDAYHTTLKGIAAFEARASVIRDWSIEASGKVPDGSLDFVFIDAEHTYEACKADIAAWAPKVRAGGVISGHDYENPDFPHWGVERAVQEYANEHGLKVQLDANYTWFIHLPPESRVH